jgi:Na+/H+ antiporter NhaD/arsenite permease-like protein
MTAEQIITLLVLIGVIAALIWDKMRADVVALGGAAILLLSGAIRPSEVQGAFGSPAIVALASLFVIAHAMELSGLLDVMIGQAVRICRRTGSIGLWILITLAARRQAFSTIHR